MPRFLFTIPHYFSRPAGGTWHGSQSGRAAWRATVLRKTVLSLHQTFGAAQCMMQLDRRETQAANGSLRGEVTVLICTSGDSHLLDQTDLPAALYQQIPCDDPPEQLGYACHGELQQRLGDADWFAYLEDDVLLQDSLFFQKLSWFSQLAGPAALLLPNRFEVDAGPHVHRAYVDGDLRAATTARWQDPAVQPEVRGNSFGQPVRFVRPSNPHAGCFFLRRDQLAGWAQQPYFLDRSEAFIGPLESTATLGIMRTFQIYKPAIESAGFLEVQHQSKQFIGQLRPKK